MKRRRADVEALIKFNIGKRHEHLKKRNKRSRLSSRAQLRDKKKVFVSAFLSLSRSPLRSCSFSSRCASSPSASISRVIFCQCCCRMKERKRANERERDRHRKREREGRILGQWVLPVCVSRSLSLSPLLNSVFAFYDISFVEKDREWKRVYEHNS